MIDLTLNSLLVPDILGYDPPFGQKVTTTPENKGGLSTQQVNDNILLPFATQRAVEVTTTDTTSKVERDARLVITGDNVTLTISGDSFAGCKLSVLAIKSATVVINDTPFAMAQGSSQDVIYTGDKWTGLYPVMREKVIQFPGQPTPSELYMATEWENISSQYAGQFFRVEGGDALPFGQTQEEGLPNIKGTTSSTRADKGTIWDSGLIVVKNATGAFVTKTKAGEVSIDTSLGSDYTAWLNDDFDASRSNNIYGKSSHVTPKNSTIRIWKRTA